MKYLLLLLLGVFCAATAAPAQVPPASQPSQPAAPDVKKDDKKDEKKDTFLFIKQVDVYPVSGPALRRVGILIKNDKIEAIGEDLEVPKEAETVDATGLRAYPGMVALNGDGIVGARDRNGFNPLGVPTIMGLAHGITTVIVGQQAVKLTYGTVEGSLLRDNLFIGLFYSSSNPRAKAQLRADLQKVRDYLRALGEFNAKKAAGDQTVKEPDQRALGAATRYLPLLRRETAGVFNVSEAQDLMQAAELAQAFGFKAVMRGAVEGWCIADKLGRAGVSAIVIPRQRVEPDDTVNRPSGSSIQNAALLHEHGVPVAVCTLKNTIEMDGQAGQDALALATEAGMAQRGGLPEDATLASVTLQAARVYGLDDRIGSLEVGKDADIMITDGELLHYATMVQVAIVNGRVAYDKKKESLYRHIRPRGDVPKADPQWWPRPFGPMPEEWRFDPAEEARKKEAAASQPASQPTSQPAESRPTEREPRGPRRRRGEGRSPESAPASQPSPISGS
jgi:imidazolonepropionase-like amidohydrolase